MTVAKPNFRKDLRQAVGAAPGLDDSVPVRIRLRGKDQLDDQGLLTGIGDDVVDVARTVLVPDRQIAKELGV